MHADAGLLSAIAEGSSGLSELACFAGRSSVTILPENRAELPLRHSGSFVKAWETAFFDANCSLSFVWPSAGAAGLPQEQRTVTDQLLRHERQGRGSNVGGQ